MTYDEALEIKKELFTTVGRWQISVIHGGKVVGSGYGRRVEYNKKIHGTDLKMVYTLPK